MPNQITKPEALNLAETDDSFQYLGWLTMNGERRAFYRTAIDAGNEPRGYKIVYVVD